MKPYSSPSGTQNARREESAFPSAFSAAQAWAQFAHTGGVADYLYYRKLENRRLEVVDCHGGTAKNQWHHSPDPCHGRGGPPHYRPYGE